MSILLANFFNTNSSTPPLDRVCAAHIRAKALPRYIFQSPPSLPLRKSPSAASVQAEPSFIFTPLSERFVDVEPRDQATVKWLLGLRLVPQYRHRWPAGGDDCARPSARAKERIQSFSYEIDSGVRNSKPRNFDETLCA